MHDAMHAPSHEAEDRRHTLHVLLGAVLLEDPKVFDRALVLARAVCHRAAELTSLLPLEHAVLALHLRAQILACACLVHAHVSKGMRI